MKRLLVLGAGFYHRRIYETLRRGGYYLVGADQNPAAPARPLAHEFHAVDIADPKRIIELARTTEVDVVLPLNEFGMRSHGAAVEELDLLGNTRQSSEWATDKEQMRLRWAEWNLPQPRFRAFGHCGNIEDCTSQARSCAGQVGFPCVIKPTDSGGSGRGVIILNTAEELEEGVAFALPHARNGRLLLEEFMEGTELTVEGLVHEGNYTTLAASDKEKPPLRTRVATSLNYPAKFDAQTMDRVDHIVDQAVQCLGLTHSATHAELIVSPKGDPKLVEIGARGGGGHIFSSIVKLVSGIDMPCALAAILCGQSPNVAPLRQDGACYRFFTPSAGILRDIHGLDKAKALPGVADIGMFKHPGDQVGSLPNSLERAGFVVTHGKTRDEAWSLANRVEQTIHFIVEPDDSTHDTA